MVNEVHSTVDELSGRAQAIFGGRGQGNGTLNNIVILSGVLSAIFFWSFSKNVFVNVYPPLALILGLVVGLLPAEGAFFGWRRILATKPDLTSKQIKATNAGLIAAVASSVFSTIALFVATVPFVPADIAAYADWLIFLSLSIPTPLQLCIIAYYSVNERATVENHERSKLSAMGFDGYIKAEQARMMAIIAGMNAALDSQLEAYGQRVGTEQAGSLLERGQQALLAVANGNGQPATMAADGQPAPDVWPRDYDDTEVATPPARPTQARR
jgi:hypothetical protein